MQVDYFIEPLDIMLFASGLDEMMVLLEFFVFESSTSMPELEYIKDE